MLRNGFYNAAGVSIRLALSLLTIPVLIRVIGVEEYGLWILVLSGAGFVNLAEAGLSHATTVFLSKDLAADDADGAAQTLTVTISAMLLLVLVAVLLMGASAALIAGFFPGLDMAQRKVAEQAFRIGAGAVGVQLLQQGAIAIEQAHGRYRTINILVTVQSLLNSLGVMVVAWFGGRTLQMITWQAAASICVLATHGWVVWILLRGRRLRPTWKKTRSLEIARYSGVAWLGSLGGALFSQADRLIVGALIGTGGLGIYAAITSVAVQVSTLSAAAVQPLLPALGQILVGRVDNEPLAERPVRQSFEINHLLALGMGGGLAILAPTIMRVMVPGAMSPEYVLALRLAVVIYSLYSLNAVGYYILFGIGAVGVYTTIQLCSGIVSIVLIAAGARAHGLIGAIAGNAGFITTWLFILSGLNRLHLPISLWLRSLAFPLTWFVLVIALSLVLTDHLVLHLTVATTQTLVLCVWFLRSQRLHIRHVYHRFLRNGNFSSSTHK